MYSSEDLSKIVKEFESSEEASKTVYTDSSYTYNSDAINMYVALRRILKQMKTQVYVTRDHNAVVLRKPTNKPYLFD